MNRSGSQLPSAQVPARLCDVRLQFPEPAIRPTSRRVHKFDPFDLRIERSDHRRNIVPVERGVHFPQRLYLSRTVTVSLLPC